MIRKASVDIVVLLTIIQVLQEFPIMNARTQQRNPVMKFIAFSTVFEKKIFFPIFSSLVSILVTQFCAIPFYERFAFPALVKNADKIQVFSNFTRDNFYYNPSENHVVNICFVCASFGYWTMSIFASIMDLLPLEKLKTQQSKSYFTITEWLEAVLLSNFNLLVSSWFITLPLMWFWYNLQVYRGEELVLSYTEKQFSIYRFLIDILIHVVVVDVWFYTTHRILHYPVLYKYIHKLHHRFKAPTAVACMYANPIEFTIGNHLGVALGPVFSNCHPYTAFFWFFLSLFNTAGSHSGYYLFGAEEHDIHHEKFRYNYGVGGMMDYLFGTRYVDSGSNKVKNS